VTSAALEHGLCCAVGQRGIVGARVAAKRLDGRAESPPESLLRLMLVDARLPMPQVNVAIFDANGGYIARPDLSYLEAKIAIEYEGAHHLDPKQFRRDTVRDQLLAALGWIVIRVTARDLRPGSSTFIDSITALLVARS
jgi:very-short-patch-repair endonuclease